MDTMQFIPILVVGFAASLGLTPLSRQIAMRLGVVDKPNQRKIHQDQKPMMGGLAIYVAFALSLLLFSPPQHMVELGAVLSGAAFLAVVGLWDDRYDLGTKKFAAMLIAALVLVAAGIQIRLFKVPVLDIGLTVFWVLAITNAINFNDNMDGLAAGISAIAAGFFLLIALNQGLTLVSGLAAALLGSAVGFLAYNFNPSSIFMGDMGSMVLGFVLAVIGIKLEFAPQTTLVTWMIPLFVLALPAFDINLVIITRLAERRSPAQAGKDHTSHRLMSLGFSQRHTLFILYSVCAIFGFLGLALSALPETIGLKIGLAALLVLAAMFGIMVFVRQRYQKKQ